MDFRRLLPEIRWQSRLSPVSGTGSPDWFFAPVPGSPNRAVTAPPSGFPRVEMVPVEDGVEGQEIRALGLPSPEGAKREQHYVTGTERHVHHQGAAGKRLAAAQRTGEQYVVGVAREAQ